MNAHIRSPIRSSSNRGTIMMNAPCGGGGAANRTPTMGRRHADSAEIGARTVTTTNSTYIHYQPAAAFFSSG